MTAAVMPVELDWPLVERYMTGVFRDRYTNPLPAEFIEAVRRLHANGLNDSEIGVRVHRTRDAVLHLRMRYGINQRVDAAVPDNVVEHRGRHRAGSLKRESDTHPSRP